MTKDAEMIATLALMAGIFGVVHPRIPFLFAAILSGLALLRNQLPW